MISDLAAIVASPQALIAIFTAIAVFATMGALACKTNQPVHEVLKGSETVGLAFVAFPRALAALPAANVFSVVFFIALLLLGIDSAFSITEAALASIIDKTGRKRVTVLTGLSIVGFSVGLLFTTKSGLNWLGTIDGVVNEGTWGIMFVGLVECLVLGWAFDLGKLRQHANKHSDWKIGIWWEWSIRLFIPTILIVLVGWSLYGDLTNPNGYLFSNDGKLIWLNFLGLVLTFTLFLVAVVLGIWNPKKVKSATGY